MQKEENHFDHDADIGIVGYGENIETCFCDIAKNMFALMANLEKVHTLQVIAFEFTETDVEFALITWLNLLLTKAREHKLIFSDFRLKRENAVWKATVSGDKWHEGIEPGIEVKGATFTMLSVIKKDHQWEARCGVDV